MTATPPQQYCLRWNNYQNNLTNVFDQLLQSEAFVDVTLACDGNSLKAHKMVLSACSPFFQTLFFDNPCSHPIVILKDINWDELKAVVEFMYRGEINVSQEQLAPLLKVAEMLKIRGLADVSRGSGAANGSQGRDGAGSGNESGSSGNHRNGPNPADFMSTSNHGSEPGSPINANGHLLNHPILQGHHLNPLNSLLNSSNTTSSSAVAAAAHAQALASLHRRKRRKMSTPERTPSPPEDDLDDQSSNQLEIDSQNGDWNNDHSPRSGDRQSRDTSANHSDRDPSGAALSMSLSSTPTPANTPSLSAAAAAAATVGMSLAGGGSTASSLVGPMGPAFLNLHAAAAAAAAVANANPSSDRSTTGGNGGNNPPSTSSSLASDMDLKPGIVEMIREEERAKMLESSHGWLGPSAASTLTDTYQYQIQNLWQKCWNQNQGGVVHALRFRERGPLKSWRPETMAEAIFAVLRDGLSLSQAARKYDIPYPTFVLYANRVHNMLGPSADGCSSNDLMSDMRPKGRGRPQRILLGSWPEEHIRGVIRAVVFRDTQGGKDDFPFIFNRETGLCLPNTPGSSSSHNGLDMTLQQFANPFLNPSSSSNSNTPTNLLSQLQPPRSNTPHQTSTPATSTSNSTGGAPRSSPNLSISATNSSTTTTSASLHGINLINLTEHGPSLNAAAAATAAALQHLHQLQQQGTLSTSTTAGATGSPSSSPSASPLQQVLASAGLLSSQAQRELIALQQRHLRRSSARDSEELSSLGLFTKKPLSFSDAKGDSLIPEAELLPIKTELPSSLTIGCGGEDEDDDALNESGNNLASTAAKVTDNDSRVIPLNSGDDEDEQFTFKQSVNTPTSASEAGDGADFVKFLNRSSPDVITGNGNSPKNSSTSDSNGNANSNNNNNDCPKGSSSGTASNGNSNNNNAGNGRSNESGNSSSNNTVEDGQTATLQVEAAARRASRSGESVTGSCSTASTTSSTATSGISTRMRSSTSGGSGRGEREVNTPSPLNFHHASTS